MKIETQSEQTARLSTDLLNEKRAQTEELPMSLAWFRRARLLGGGPPFVRVGNRVFYRRAELRAWLAEREGALVHAVRERPLHRACHKRIKARHATNSPCACGTRCSPASARG